MRTSCLRLGARVVNELITLLAFLTFRVVLAADAVLDQLRTSLALVILSEAIAFHAGGAEGRRVAGQALWERVCAFDADVAISVEEVTIETDLTLVLCLAGQAISKTRRTLLLLCYEEGLLTFFASYVSNAHATQAKGYQLIT